LAKVVNEPGAKMRTSGKKRSSFLDKWREASMNGRKKRLVLTEMARATPKKISPTLNFFLYLKSIPDQQEIIYGDEEYFPMILPYNTTINFVWSVPYADKSGFGIHAFYLMGICPLKLNTYAPKKKIQ
jgi:hypothetical protein